jgi:multidrug efflux system outer membrane protein
MKAMTTLRHPPFKLAAGAVLALAVSGCVHIPPDTSRATQPDLARVQHAPGIALARDAWPTEQWWREYHDPQLDALVAQALAGSPTLAVAQARLAGAAAAVRAEQAAASPSVTAAGSLNRQRYSATGLFPEPIGGGYFNDTTLQVKASYDLDWWGRHRALIAAATGEANARQAEASQAEHTLAASVAHSYFRLQMLWARQDNAQALVAFDQQILADRKARIAHGLATIDEQRSVEQDIGALQEQAERFGGEAAREREALRALVGADSAALAGLARRVPAPPAAALPSQLGIELLARRPNLQAARWRVEAALGRAKASEAAYYPDLNLAAAIGLNSVSISRLLEYGSRTLLAGAALQMPLFHNNLDARLASARAGRDEAIADYNQAVFDAVREVAQEGATLQAIARQQDAHRQTIQAAGELAANAEARFRRGLADRGAVLQARLGVLRQQDAGLQLADAQLQSQVELAKALGGGYRADPQAAHAQIQTQPHQASNAP